MDEQHAVAALRAMRVVKSGDLNTTPLRTADFWSVPKEAWPHIGRLLSLHELRIVASDVRGEPFEHIGRLKNLCRLTVINSKCSPTSLDPGARLGEPGVPRGRVHGARRKRCLAEQATRSVDTCGAGTKSIAMLPLGRLLKRNSIAG